MSEYKRFITREELIERIDDQRGKEPFYRIRALNYQGNVKDSDNQMPLEEESAKWLCETIGLHDLGAIDKLLLENQTMELEKDRFSEEPGPIHKNMVKCNNTNRNEENIAKGLFNHPKITSDIQIVDYQVPVNRVLYSGHGKVDLVMKDGKDLVLGELKDNKSKETLLRAIVEARTYQLKITSTGMTTAEKGKRTALGRFEACYGGAETMHSGIILFEKTRPYESWRNEKLTALHRLIKEWDIRIYLATEQKNQDSDLSYGKKFDLKRLN